MTNQFLRAGSHTTAPGPVLPSQPLRTLTGRAGQLLPPEQEGAFCPPEPSFHREPYIKESPWEQVPAGGRWRAGKMIQGLRRLEQWNQRKRGRGGYKKRAPQRLAEGREEKIRGEWEIGANSKQEKRRKNAWPVFNSKYLWTFSNSKTVTLSVNLSKITGGPRLFWGGQGGA